MTPSADRRRQQVDDDEKKLGYLNLFDVAQQHFQALSELNLSPFRGRHEAG